MKKTLILIVVLSLWSSSCGIFHYGNNVKHDSSEKLQKAKIVIRELGFKSVVINMADFKRNKIAPFRLYLKILKIGSPLSLSNVKNPPYYSFDAYNPEYLELSVSREIYSVLNIGDTLIKASSSDSIRIGNMAYMLISPKSSSWN
jgi:hypothetical protein